MYLKNIFFDAEICFSILDPKLEAGKLAPFSIMLTLVKPFKDKNCWKEIHLQDGTTKGWTRKDS